MELFPAVPLASWRESNETLHRFLQLVGKIRLAASARANHWWNVPFHLTGRGLTTRPMGIRDGNPIFTIDLDFVDHRLVATTGDGRTESFPLPGHSVASFHDATLDALQNLGVVVVIPHDHPFDLPEGDRPFAADTDHASYDPAQVNRYWRVLSQVNLVLQEFAAGFSGKTSPVHHFWHTMDIAVTRFSDRVVGLPEADPVTREAYSREVISAGFWFGDPTYPEPAFYSYTAPEPPGLADQPLLPETAEWLPKGYGHLAVLRYDEVRAQADPWATVLTFLESAYVAGARLAGWDIAGLACPGGITDPILRERSDASGGIPGGIPGGVTALKVPETTATGR